MRSSIALFTAALLALPAFLEAQKVTAGKWTGTITPPNGGAINATFDVRQSGDTTKITMNADGRTIETMDVKVEATRLLFTFIPGNETVRCTLLLQDDKKSYSGDCIDSGGAKGTIAMTPPKA